MKQIYRIYYVGVLFSDYIKVHPKIMYYDEHTELNFSVLKRVIMRDGLEVEEGEWISPSAILGIHKVKNE